MTEPSQTPQQKAILICSSCYLNTGLIWTWKAESRVSPSRPAARGCHLNIVCRLLELKVDATSEIHDNAPQDASEGGGHLDTLQLLLEYNADINYLCFYQKIPP